MKLLIVLSIVILSGLSNAYAGKAGNGRDNSAPDHCPLLVAAMVDYGPKVRRQNGRFDDRGDSSLSANNTRGYRGGSSAGNDGVGARFMESGNGEGDSRTGGDF